jgi:hypothetical protein
MHNTSAGGLCDPRDNHGSALIVTQVDVHLEATVVSCRSEKQRYNSYKPT